MIDHQAIETFMQDNKLSLKVTFVENDPLYDCFHAKLINQDGIPIGEYHSAYLHVAINEAYSAAVAMIEII